MGTIQFLESIRSTWVDRVAHRLARAEGVRESFLEQLNHFFDLLIQAIETGDPAWLDPLIAEWATAQTQTDLERAPASLMPFISQIFLQTSEVCQEVLTAQQALQVLSALMPLFTYIYEQAMQREVQVRIGQIKDELRTVQEQLERLDRSKSNFISVAAHELKTPLTLLEGYASMLREQFPEEDQDSAPVILLKGIDNGTRRLREIVDDMIDVSLIDNNMLDLNYQPVWLNRLFGILANEFETTLAKRKLTLEIREFPGSEEMTFADSERLYQAFRNLLLNAIKFTPDRGKITIDGRKLPGFVEVTFSDTGIGIDPDDQVRIFDKFGQLGDVQYHSSGKTKFKGGGPGLGLPITKGIIEGHGGTIWVESEGCDEVKNPGSTFHVLLPLRTGPPDDKQALLFNALAQAEGTSDYGG